MKIAHLSDLHISPKSRPQNLEYTRKLLNYVLEEGVDHIVITGDLTDLAEPGDFYSVRKVFQEFGLLNPFKMTLIVGNHDIFGGVHLARDIFHFPGRCASIDYEKRVQEFKSYFLETFENIYAPPPPLVFPFVKPVGDILFIGLNSIAKYNRGANIFGSKGRIYTQQMNDIENMMSMKTYEARRRILLIHHHFNKQVDTQFSSRQPMLKRLELHANRLKYKWKMYKFMRRHNVDLVLHGHEHVSHQYMKKGFRFMNAGGCIDKNKPGQLRVNFIQYLGHELYTEIRMINESALKTQRKIFADTLVMSE